MTKETLEFTYTGVVPNRGGLGVPDQFTSVISYSQKVDEVFADKSTKGIHEEHGFFIYTPASVAPDDKDSIVRLATIPHGDSLVARSVKGTDYIPGFEAGPAPIRAEGGSCLPFLTP